MIAAGTRARAPGQRALALPVPAVQMPVAAPAVPSAPGANGGLIALKSVIEVIAPPLAVGPSAQIALIALIALIATASAPASAPVRSAVSMVLVRLPVKDPDRSAPVSIVPALIAPGSMDLAAVAAAPSVVPVVPKAQGGLASAAVPELGPPSRIDASIAVPSAATAIRRHPAVR